MRRAAIAGALLAGLGFCTGYAVHGGAPASCTFDGGGTIANAQLATTSQGTTWVCDDGTLAQVYP